MKIPSWPKNFRRGYINYSAGKNADKNKSDKLEHVFNALERVDEPHLRLPPTVHFAGTNGKGSTLAFVESILYESGYSCHSYTSPHLVEFNERIKLNYEPIADEELLDILRECDDKIKDDKITFFEGTTVAAFMAFARHEADFLLLEVGMGGRFDATNAIKRAALSVITPISFDHMEFLGNTIEEIAFEKAGIIKHGGTCVLAWQENKAAADVVRNACRKLECKLIEVEKVADKFYKLGLTGTHQQQNANTAAAVCRELKMLGYNKITDSTINAGLLKAHWPARLQKIPSMLFVNLAPEGAGSLANIEFVLDGSHNAQGGQTVHEFADSFGGETYKVCVLSMKDGKDVDGFLKNIAGLFDVFVLTEFKNDSFKAFDADRLMKKLLSTQNLKGEAEVFVEKDVRGAIRKAFLSTKDDKNNLIIATGSLFLAGEVLGLIKNSN